MEPTQYCLLLILNWKEIRMFKFYTADKIKFYIDKEYLKYCKNNIFILFTLFHKERYYPNFAQFKYKIKNAILSKNVK